MSRTNLHKLITDLRAVADDLQSIADGMANDKPAPTQEEPEKAIRMEDVRAVLAAKSRDGYGAQVRKLIKAHGGSKLSDIDPSEYSVMLKEAEVFGHAT